MGRDEECGGKSRRNARISLSVLTLLVQKRKKLIFFVTEKSYSIGKASSRVKIKLSTAKMIVKRYNTHGTFFEPRPRTPRRLSEQQESSRSEDGHRAEIEEQRVKVEHEPGEAGEEQRVAARLEEAVKIEEPTGMSRMDVLSLPTMASWNVLPSQYPYPYFFDGYVIHPCPALLQPLFL